MTAALRAWLHRWSLLPLHPRVASAVLLLLGGVAACARSEAPPAVEAEVEGYWLQSITRADQLVACGHGQHAWGWRANRAGLWLVDAEGVEKPLVPDLFLPGTQVMNVVPTADAERAWVHVLVPGPKGHDLNSVVYLVSHEGAVQGQPLFIASDDELMLASSQNRERLWLVSSFLSKLWVLDAAGQIWWQDLTAQGHGWASVSRVVPVGMGTQAWLVLNQNLYHVDLEVRLPLQRLPFEGRVFDIVPSDTPQRAWVVAQTSGLFAQLYLVSRDMKKAPAPLLGGVAVDRVYPHRQPSRLWVAWWPALGEPVKELRLVALEEKPGSPQGGKPTVEVSAKGLGRGLRADARLDLVPSPEGHLWAHDTQGFYRLSEEGDVSARSALLRPGTSLEPLSGERAWATLAGQDVVLLTVKDGAITAGPSLKVDSGSARLLSGDARGAWLLVEEQPALDRIQLEGDTLKSWRVLKNQWVQDVLTIPGRSRAWIAGSTRGFLFGAAEDSVRAVVGFAGGGRLEHAAGGKVRLQKPLVARAPLESLALEWPGRLPAAEVQLALQAQEDGALAVEAVRKKEGATPFYNWTAPPMTGERLYRATVSHAVENGTQLSVTFRNVPVGAPLLDRVWVRTALACLGVTLLVFLPMLLLRPSAVSRRWLPLVGYGVSLLGGGAGQVLGLLRETRIHLPTLVAVVGAELVLCAVLGLLSPALFRRLVFTHPFSWVAAPLLRWPAFRRRFFAPYVRQLRRRVDVASKRANGEVYVELSSLVTQHSSAGLPPITAERTAEELSTLLTHQRVHLFIQCAGGRGKSALLRQLMRLSLERFEKQPDAPLPVHIDPAAEDLEQAAREALKDLGLPEGLRDALLEAGDFFLVMDGLTESKLPPEALRRYLERESGAHAPLLLTARPSEEYRAAMEHAARWAAVEPKRMDDAGLARFQAAYPGEGGSPTVLSEPLKRICRGRAADGSYVPLLVRLALRFGEGDVDSVINLYRAVFAGLLKRAPDDAATEELLAFAEKLCLESYWEHQTRLLVFRDHPEEEKLKVLLDAGMLVPADARPGPVPTHVRFFHDSMQSYLTARALYARGAAGADWSCLWRAAGHPRFAREDSDLMTEAGSELFQMCAYVFGHDARLREELVRQLELCAEANDERLSKEAILGAVPEELRRSLRRVGRGLGPGDLLVEASQACSNHSDGEALFLLYARMAPKVWPWTPEEAGAAHAKVDSDAA
jgi:hypothetical protein